MASNVDQYGTIVIQGNNISAACPTYVCSTIVGDESSNDAIRKMNLTTTKREIDEVEQADNDRKTDMKIRRLVGTLCLLCVGLVCITVYNSVVLQLSIRDDCEHSPCQHGGLCIDGVDVYQCVCPYGYTGLHCEQDIDDCEVKPCLHGGSCTDAGRETFSCACLPGYTGRVCEAQENMLDCQDVYVSGRHLSGVYALTRLSDGGVYSRYQAYCHMDTSTGAGWMVLMRRQNGLIDFNRDWSQYKEGFGDRDQEYWIGNDAMHQLTSNSGRAYRVRVDMVTAGGLTLYAEYATFRVGGGGSNYTLNVAGPYLGTAGDMLTWHSGRQFSTRDRDHDDQPSAHCAATFQGGWWYRDCFRVHLTGPYRRWVTGLYPGVTWNHDGKYPDLVYTELKVKPT